MGSLRALQEWCRSQCDGYKDVEITDMSKSFRDGLAFCAIIHRHRQDLIDFDSLSKDNVYENNRLAFEIAESELGIPALLDPEDMVSMKVPDRLSVITYVSQYYNFFCNRSHVNTSSMKRPGSAGHNEPETKKAVTPAEEPKVLPFVLLGSDSQLRRSTLSSTCQLCQKHVHLVQRILVDGKLYHRNCFRCKECSSTLLPGSYKEGSAAGTLVCTRHFNKSTHNGRPDLSRIAGSVGLLELHPAQPEAPIMYGSEEKSPPRPSNEQSKAPNVSEALTEEKGSDTVQDHEKEELKFEMGEIRNGNIASESKPETSVPSNPFEDSEEEEESITSKHAKNEISLIPGRPVPAPRRPPDPSPPAPRPAPRIRPPRPADSPAFNGDPTDFRRSFPRPRERSNSPGSSSLSSDTPKPKDPPWLALVQSEPKKKPAPAPPPAPGLATPPQSGSIPSLSREGSRPATPPPSTNPFEDNDGDDEEEGTGQEDEGVGGLGPTVVNHPWYRITQSGDAMPSEQGSPKSKKRVAPRVPAHPSPAAASYSQPSSTSPSPALSTESISSSSDHSSSRSQPADQDHAFIKSVSEPSISGPTFTLTNDKPGPAPGPAPSTPPANTSSAPATPQSVRSSGMKVPRPPPPRPPTTPSPLAKAGPAPPQSKRTCKENPFNRKASPNTASPTARPPKGPRPARPPAPGHGFPLIKRKVQSDQYIPVEDIHVEMEQLEKQLDDLEQRGVELEQKLRDCQNDEEEERMLVDWFTLIHEKHMLVRREAELVYTAKQQNLEERQADVEYELRCLLNKPEREWSEEDRSRERHLMAELVTIIEQRNQIINSMDQDRQREEEEDKVLAAVIKKKEFHKEPEGEQRKKSAKFKPMKVLKMLSPKNEGGKSKSPHRDKS